MKKVDRSIELKKELDSHRPLKKEDELRIMQKFRLDWNYHSNHLEGNSLTYGETKALILFGITAQGKPLKDHFEVTGHNEAVNWILDVVKEDRPLTENFIRELHRLILKEPYEVDAITPDGQPTKKQVKVGEYKTTPNHVKTSEGEIFRFATPEETPAKMNDLVRDFRKKSTGPDVNPIILSAEFHYRFTRIHPFDDGNGRTARILMNFILMKFGYPPVIIKTEDKENYFSALRQADAGILDAFIEYIANNLVHSLEIMIQGAKGESIEEPDDLDKEIALLDQIVSAFGKEQDRKRKSEENLQEIFQKSIVPLAKHYFKKGHLLTKFYVRFLFTFKIKLEGSGHIIEKEIIPESFPDLTIPTNSSSIILMYTYNVFKTTGINIPRFESHIEFYFSEAGYQVKGKLPIPIIEKSYWEQLTEKEIDQLVKAEIKRHKTFIEKTLDEARGN